MTTQKQLNARIRERMAATGERYAAARAQLVGAKPEHYGAPLVDAGWTFRGGSDPDAAALAHVLANTGVFGSEGPLSQELILLIAGGLGAGYILWKFQHDDSRIVWPDRSLRLRGGSGPECWRHLGPRRPGLGSSPMVRAFLGPC